MQVFHLLHALATLPQRKTHDTHQTGEWVCPRAGLDTVKFSKPHLNRIHIFVILQILSQNKPENLTLLGGTLTFMA